MATDRTTKIRVINIVVIRPPLEFRIDFARLKEDPHTLYVADETCRYTSIKPDGATKAITIFPNGSMNVAGNKSIQEARKNISLAVELLTHYKLERS